MENVEEVLTVEKMLANSNPYSQEFELYELCKGYGIHPNELEGYLDNPTWSTQETFFQGVKFMFLCGFKKYLRGIILDTIQDYEINHCEGNEILPTHKFTQDRVEEIATRIDDNRYLFNLIEESIHDEITNFVEVVPGLGKMQKLAYSQGYKVDSYPSKEGGYTYHLFEMVTKEDVSGKVKQFVAVFETPNHVIDYLKAL